MEDLLSHLVKAIKSAKTSPEQVDLPIFKPDSTDAKKWLLEIADIKAEFEWSDQQTLVRLGRFLTGVSKTWHDLWSPDTRSWNTFQREFLEAFAPKKNLGRLLSEAAEFSSDNCNTYETYIFEKTGMLRNLRANWKESDLVELIIHGIKEKEVQTAATNLNCEKIADLLAFLGSIIKRRSQVGKHPAQYQFGNQSYDGPSRKRQRDNYYNESPEPRKFNTKITCYRCGKSGHIQRSCYENLNASASTEKKPSTETQAKNSTCSFCAKTGHTVDQCFMRQNIEKRKKVNFCSTGLNFTCEKFELDGHVLYGIIDTENLKISPIVI